MVFIVIHMINVLFVSGSENFLVTTVTLPLSPIQSDLNLYFQT